MPEIIDSPEEIELHKTHVNNLHPETCDLCWMEVPFTLEEELLFQESEKWNNA
jgi:hypothetical protein